MGRLEIVSSKPVMQINTEKAKLSIIHPKPKMRIRSVPARMVINSKKSTFKVNWQKVRNESGLPSPSAQVQQQEQRAKDTVMDIIARTVEEGNQMAMNYTHRNEIAEVQKQRAMLNLPEINLGSMPQSSPEVEWDIGTIQIEWSNHELNIDWDMDDYRPKITVDPHSVEIRVHNARDVKITYLDKGDVHERGKKVDKKV